VLEIGFKYVVSWLRTSVSVPWDTTILRIYVLLHVAWCGARFSPNVHQGINTVSLLANFVSWKECICGMVASTICFAAGVITVLLLPVLSKTTYISENALMPGLPEFTPNWRQFSWCTAARIVQSLTWFTHLRYICFVGSLFVCKHGKMQLWIFAIDHLLTGVEGCRFWGHFACLLNSDFWLILWGGICSPCSIVESLQCILCLSVGTGVYSERFLWGWQTLPGCRYTSGLFM